jgi:hypothetical protein
MLEWANMGLDEMFCCTSFQCFNMFWYIEFPCIKVKWEEKWVLEEMNTSMKFFTCHFNVPRLVGTMWLLGEFSFTQDPGNVKRYRDLLYIAHFIWWPIIQWDEGYPGVDMSRVRLHLILLFLSEWSRLLVFIPIALNVPRFQVHWDIFRRHRSEFGCKDILLQITLNVPRLLVQWKSTWSPLKWDLARRGHVGSVDGPWLIFSHLLGILILD